MELFSILKARKKNKLIKPLDILKMEDSCENKTILKHPSQEVKTPLSEEDDSLLLSMKASLYKLGGVGLAAPQVGVNKKMAVIFIPKEASKSGIEPVDMHEIINPEYRTTGDDSSIEIEGCHSIRSLTGCVERNTNIKVVYEDRLGVRYEREARGFYARVLQHEIDHLNGVTIVDRMIFSKQDQTESGHILLT